MTVQPYLFFEGRCEEAVEFYRRAIGAEVVMLMRNKESPDQSQVAPGTENKVLHAAFKVGDSMVLASDGYSNGKPEFKGFSLSIEAPDPAAARRMFDALSQDGSVQLPLQQTFFSPSFGMLTDRFGVGWMIMVQPKQ